MFGRNLVASLRGKPRQTDCTAPEPAAVWVVSGKDIEVSARDIGKVWLHLTPDLMLVTEITALRPLTWPVGRIGGGGGGLPCPPRSVAVAALSALGRPVTGGGGML